MNIKTKKSITTVLALSLGLSIPAEVFASNSNTSISNETQSVEEILSLPKKDITFIKGGYNDLSHVEYTYTSNEEQFKVIEDSNNDLSHVQSTIYKKNDLGEFDKFAEQTVDVKGSIVVTTKIGDKKTVENIARPQVIDNSSANSVTKDSYSTNEFSANSSNLPISDWQYYGTFKYSTTIVKYTIVAVTAIIAGIVSTATTLGAGTQATISGTTTLVSYIVNDQVPKIYYTNKVYYKTVVPPNPNQLRIKVAEKTTHTFYSDETRTKQLPGSPITSNFHLEGYGL